METERVVRVDVVRATPKGLTNATTCALINKTATHKGNTGVGLSPSPLPPRCEYDAHCHRVN